MFAHVPLAIGTQLITWLLGWSLDVPAVASIWLGCFTASAVCLMREITQREHQWIERFGAGRRAN